MLVQTMTLDGNLFDISSLLGVRGRQEVLQEINQNTGGSYFGSADNPFRTGFQNFMRSVVEPIRNTGFAIANVVGNIFKEDKIVPIRNIEDLKKGIPPSMWLPIVYYEPVREMLDDGIISGFGIDPDKLVKDDPYDHICKSGVVEINDDTLNENGEFWLEFTENSDDPELTVEEKLAITATRRFIDEFFADEVTKYMDITDYPNLHG